MSKIYTSMVEEDPEDPESVIITFPDEMIVELGWFEGMEIEWSVDETTKQILVKKKDSLAK